MLLARSLSHPPVQVSRYALSVQAFDSGSPAMSSAVTVNVDVADVNDNPPVFSPPNATAVVQVKASVAVLCSCQSDKNTTVIMLKGVEKQNIKLC